MEDEVTRYPPKRIELRPARRPDEGYTHELHFTTEGSNTTNIEKLTPADLAQLREVVKRPAGPVLTPDPGLMVREGDEVVGSLGPDALLVMDASHCIVICTPERRITVGDVGLWCDRLWDTRQRVAVLDQLADEERRIAQAERLRAERRPGRAE